MKKLFFIGLLITFAVNTLYSQDEIGLYHSEFEKRAFSSDNPLQILLASNPEVDLIKYNQYQADIAELVERLQAKRSKYSEPDFVEKVFYLTHRKKLNWYENYTMFSDIFDQGKYDCLTGTALFALLLDEFEIPYHIYEFDFHILLIAQIDEDSVLIEATDPLTGFIRDQQVIAERIHAYQLGIEESSDPNQPIGSKASPVSGHISNVITLQELAGLQYFNIGVKYFNENALIEANRYLQKANFLYPSERIKEIKNIFSQQLLTIN